MTEAAETTTEVVETKVEAEKAETEDVTGLKSALKQERDARKAADKQLKDLSDKLEALEGKDKSDVERLTGERDKLKADLEAREALLHDRAIEAALTTAATRAGARYPDLIIGRVAKDAELDDDLTVKNADALIATAKRDYPDLFRVVDGKADGGKTDSSTDTSNVRGFDRLRNAHGDSARATR